jgi:hypothetical protein
VQFVTLLEKMIVSFTAHRFRFCQQYHAVRLAKENLQDGHILLLVDFSENYSEKYAKETQSKHFGNRSQIVIHQGVLYCKVHILLRVQPNWLWKLMYQKRFQ